VDLRTLALLPLQFSSLLDPDLPPACAVPVLQGAERVDVSYKVLMQAWFAEAAQLAMATDRMQVCRGVRLLPLNQRFFPFQTAVDSPSDSSAVIGPRF
jgi:hypothetical protein